MTSSETPPGDAGSGVPTTANPTSSTTTPTSTSVPLTTTTTTTTPTPCTEEKTTERSPVESEYHDIQSKHAWPLFFQFIRNESAYDYTCNESKKPENKNLNRYRDVLPYDHTRVVLKKGTCDYINANIVRTEHADRQYILTQGPIPSTAGHFWLMVWEQGSKAIIMLNKVIEKNLVKCHQYWPLPNAPDRSMTFPDVGLKLEFISKTESSDYTTSTLRLTDTETNESREILHFHYTTWPDFGVPKSPTAFLRFLADVRQSGLLESDVGPAVVHCSAGIGRSGTFCLVDTSLLVIEKSGIDSLIVKDVLLDMRRCRMGLIQMPDQLRFSYEAIIQGSKHLPLTNNIGNDKSVTNHYDVVNNVSNSSQDDDDEPPPLPPPRGESLTRSMITDQTPSPSAENGKEDVVSDPFDKPLPCEPPKGVNSNSTANHVDDDDDDDDVSASDPSASVGDETISSPSSPDSNELRRRRMEKKERLDAQVREMKRKQKESEDWRNFKRSLFSPLTIGVGAAIIGGMMIYGYYYLRG